MALVLDVALILLVFWAVHAWHTRNLPIDAQAPSTFLAALDGSGIQSAVQLGSPGVVYFFAPWCFYCRHSIGNLDELVAAGSIAWAATVALDYDSRDEVRSFIDQTGVTLPVLMGDRSTASDWGVKAFPTYFVIDSQGRIASRSVGYSTWVGLRVRAAVAD